MKKHLTFILCLAIVTACGSDDDPSAPRHEEPSTCLASGTTRLVLSSGNFQPLHLASDGTTLFAGGMLLPQFQPFLMSARLTSDGAQSASTEQYVGGALALRADGSLFYLAGDVTVQGSSAIQNRHGVILRYAFGGTRTIADGTDLLADQLLADPNGASWIAGSSVPGGAPTLRRWDEASGQTRDLGETNMNRHLSDGTEIFHIESKDGSNTIIAHPIAGGTPRLVGAIGAALIPALLSVDATSLFFLTDVEGIVFVMDKTSGKVTREIKGALGRPTASVDAVADDTHIYWVTHGPPFRLVRLAKATGISEELRNGNDLGAVVALDSCNLYFVTDGAVFARGK